MKKINPGAYLLCLLGGVFLGISGYTFYYAEGASYLSNDPKACINCHIMQDQFDGWQKSSHKKAASCVQCHLPQKSLSKYIAKLRNGYRHSTAFTFQNFDEPIRIKEDNFLTLNQNCMECHKIMVSEISSHKNLKVEPMNCVKCHTNVGHAATN